MKDLVSKKNMFRLGCSLVARKKGKKIALISIIYTVYDDMMTYYYYYTLT